MLHSFRLIKAVRAELSIPAAQRLSGHFQVRYVEPDASAYALAGSAPWGIRRMFGCEKYPFATWSISTGKSRSVAVLDTGIQESHPQLPALAGGTNTFDDTPASRDDNGHGTHVAGIISAGGCRADITGAAPNTRLYSVKVLGRLGTGSVSSVTAGIEWSVREGIDIINMSLGVTRFTQTLRDMCRVAFKKGSLLVAAAGNRGADVSPPQEVTYPAKFDSVMAVGASDRHDRRAPWSSQGREVELIAPGVQIVSTIPPDTHAARSGTSMAAPHVSAAGALAWAAEPALDNCRLRAILHKTAEYLHLQPRQQGCGLVRADRAVRAAACMLR